MFDDETLKATGAYTLTIDGTVEGKISLEGHTLTLGSNARITADVKADAVVVAMTNSYYQGAVRQLKRRYPKKPVLVVSFGSPYMLTRFPEVDAYLCLYSNHESAQVAAAETLHAFLHRVPPGDPARLPLARRLGPLVGLLHGAGYRNRDLKAPNFLVGPGLRVWLVDLDGVARRGREDVLRHRAQDFARLQKDVFVIRRPPRSELRAFIRGYRRWFGWAPGDRLLPLRPAPGGVHSRASYEHPSLDR